MASEAHAHGAEHHGALQHQFNDLDQQRESFALGMWLFLATELMMFGGLFFAYFLYRWKFEAAFHWGSSHQNIGLGTLNTFVLLTSSLTMALAVHASALNNRQGIVRWLSVTFLLGLVFLVIKGFEWSHEYEVGLAPSLNWTYFLQNPQQAEHLAALGVGSQNAMMYFIIYFCMTGLHAIHMLIGLGLVGYFAFLASRGHFERGNDQPVEILGLYWHLIDIIWVFLFPLLYLIDGFKPHQLFGGGGH